MRSDHPLAIAGTLVVLALAEAASADPASSMSFKNNLIPGHFTAHRLDRTIRRKSNRLDHVETLTYEQEATLTQCNIDESTPGKTMVYQMIVDEPARPIALFHDAKRIQPTPDASRFSLSKESTRLHSASKTARDAPVQVPLCDPAERAVLAVLLDFAHWPVKKIDAGHRWQRQVELEGFEGSQTFEFIDLVPIDGEMTGRVTMFVEGKFTGGLEREYAFHKGQAILHWSRPDRSLVKMEAQADYERNRADPADAYHMKLRVGLTDLGMLDEDAQELVKVQLTAFAGALKTLHAGKKGDTLRICREFREAWPRSMWLPAIEELARQAQPRPSETHRFSTAELKAILAKAIVAWEAARSTQDRDLEEQTRKLFEQMSEEYRSKLTRLASDAHHTVRGQAAFTLAFSKRPEHVSLVERAAKDPSATVRAMALAGIAACGRRDVNVQLLLDRLDDKKPGVRRRACQAIAVCVPPEHFSVVKIVEKVDHLMVFDETAVVRREAVRALAAVGAQADVPKLKKALKHELDPSIREEIEKAIESLQKRG